MPSLVQLRGTFIGVNVLLLLFAVSFVGSIGAVDRAHTGSVAKVSATRTVFFGGVAASIEAAAISGRCYVYDPVVGRRAVLRNHRR